MSTGVQKWNIVCFTYLPSASYDSSRDRGRHCCVGLKRSYLTSSALCVSMLELFLALRHEEGSRSLLSGAQIPGPPAGERRYTLWTAGGGVRLQAVGAAALKERRSGGRSGWKVEKTTTCHSSTRSPLIRHNSPFPQSWRCCRTQGECARTRCASDTFVCSEFPLKKEPKKMRLSHQPPWKHHQATQTAVDICLRSSLQFGV